MSTKNKRIKQIKKRLQVITKGPWKIRKDFVEHDGFIEAPKENPDYAYDIEILGEDDTLYSTRNEDMKFIANAPEDMKFLLNLLEEKEANENF